jgi:hypothetical protein
MVYEQGKLTEGEGPVHLTSWVSTLGLLIKVETKIDKVFILKRSRY